MEPSIKQIIVGEQVTLSHIEGTHGVAIISFEETSQQLVILDEFAVAGLLLFGETWLTDPRAEYEWHKVTIECYYRTPIVTICLMQWGHPESKEGEPMWVRGFDPYSEFVKIVYKSARNKNLIVQ